MPTALTPTLNLPDLLSACPIKPSKNLHYEKGASESSSWINSYNVFSASKKAALARDYNELLVAHTYPYAGYEEFRTCCDFVNLLFVVDEISDDQGGAGARDTGNVFLQAMCDPEWDDGSALASITKHFRQRYFRTAGPNTARRFLTHCKDYIECVGTEAELRERGEVLDVDAYTALRRENSAIRLCFGLFEYALGFDLPDEVFENEAFMELYFAGCDLVCWANDLYSYDMELAKGHRGNNIITVLMESQQFSLQDAADSVGVHFADLMQAWSAAQSRLPSWGPQINADVAKYIEATGHWIRGNLDWSFASERYFGPEHLTIQRTLQIQLRPAE